MLHIFLTIFSMVCRFYIFDNAFTSSIPESVNNWKDLIE